MFESFEKFFANAAIKIEESQHKEPKNRLETIDVATAAPAELIHTNGCGGIMRSRELATQRLRETTKYGTFSWGYIQPFDEQEVKRIEC